MKDNRCVLDHETALEAATCRAPRLAGRKSWRESPWHEYCSVNDMALREFLLDHRALIETQCRETLLNEAAPKPSEAELERGIPIFMNQLIDLYSRTEKGKEVEIGRTAAEYGAQLFRLGFTISEVVHGYGAFCQVVTKLAGELKMSITAREFEVLNRSLDVAIAEAVTEYEHQRDQDLSQQNIDRLGSFAHELGNALGTATISFDLIRMGTVGSGGQTAAALNRSLMRMNTLIERALSEVRLKAGAAPIPERLCLGDVLDEITPSLIHESERRGVKVDLEVDRELAIESDEQLLLSIFYNLLQNAIKYSPDGGRVIVRSLVADEKRFAIEVEDQCGGLPPGNPEELFHPFVRRNQRKPGVGLGLALVARSVKVLGGEVGVRNLPGKGCIFTVDLPRLLPARAHPVSAVSSVRGT